MSDKMEIKNTKGRVAGVVAWMIFLLWGISDLACLKASICGGWDLLLWSMISVGMLGPAWIVACLVSEFFEDKK